MSETRTSIALKAGSFAAADLHVIGVTGREVFFEPYRFVVDFVPASVDTISLTDLLMQEALLTLTRPDGTERLVHGVLDELRMHEVRAGRPVYRARLVPRLDLLRHRRRSRVFQNQTVPEIVKAVLTEGKVAVRNALGGSYAPREYCVQYRETDLEFVRRLLQEEGIFFWFEHDPSQHVLVLGDRNSACPDLPGSPQLPFRRPDELGPDDAESEYVQELRRSMGRRVQKSTLEDYDFAIPDYDLETSSGGGSAEWYEYPARSLAPGELKRLATVRLEELQHGAEAFEGVSRSIRFEPGRTFEVTDHPAPSFGARMLLLSVEHSAVQQERAGAASSIECSYQNRFTAIPASRPYRPQRATVRRPRIVGAQTATVVGPAGEEIHIDRHGRIKVQFHWDREGPRNDRSSCFVRLAQAWSGPGFGAHYVPRIGQEVLIRFREGDPDRPAVVGAVYNGSHPPPVQLPADKTQSTVRTASSPGGQGSNELRFEDAAQAEQIYVHAQKDKNILVENDKEQRILANESLSVTKDRSRTVNGFQSLQVALDDESTVHQNQKLTVAEERKTDVGLLQTEQVDGNQAVSVQGDRELSISQAACEMVGLASALTIGAGYAITVGAASSQLIGGLKSVEVGGACIEVVGLDREEQAGGDAAYQIGGKSESDIRGTAGFAASKDRKDTIAGKMETEATDLAGFAGRAIELQAEKVSFIVGGKLALSLTRSGNILVGASDFTLDGSNLEIKGSSVAKEEAGSAQSQSASVKKLKALSKKSVSVVTVKDAAGSPVPHTRWKATLPDGSVQSGRTDSQGKGSIPVSPDGPVEVSFPDLDDTSWS